METLRKSSTWLGDYCRQCGDPVLTIDDCGLCTEPNNPPKFFLNPEEEHNTICVSCTTPALRISDVQPRHKCCTVFCTNTALRCYQVPEHYSTEMSQDHEICECLLYCALHYWQWYFHLDYWIDRAVPPMLEPKGWPPTPESHAKLGIPPPDPMKHSKT